MPTSISTPRAARSEWLLRARPFSLALAAAFSVLTLLIRFAPLPENFAMFGALAMFCGVFLTGTARWLLPLLVLFAADCIGHFGNVPGMGFYNIPSMVLNYVGFAAFSAVGAGWSWWMQRRPMPAFAALALLPLGILAGSAAFFAISNFGAWLDPRMGYDQTVAGLGRCYWMGLPFWRSTLTSDLCFGIAFAAVAVVVGETFSRSIKSAA